MQSYLLSVNRKYDKQAYMLNRVQEAHYEKQVKHISTEKRVQLLTSATAVKSMNRKRQQIELFKEKAAQDKVQRENMEQVKWPRNQ